jgi:RES domain-containing protein
MVDLSALAAAIAAAHPLAVPYRGLAYRAIRLRYFANFATAQPLFCPPGGLVGSRYVPPQGPEALYLAVDPATAYREVNQDFFRVARTPAGRAQVRAGGIRPVSVVTIGVHVQVARLLDLSRRQTRRRLGIHSIVELLRPWAGIANAPTQVLGGGVFTDEFFEGVIYPSAQNAGHVCLVLFRNRFLPDSHVHFHDGPTGLHAQLP